MEDDLFSFTHSDFIQRAKNTAEVFWNDKTFTDITLVTCDDRQVHAHNIILTSFSGLFRNILDKNQHPKPLIYLKDITHSHLILILRFLYLGSCEVKSGDLEAFLATAKELKVEGIDQGLDQEERTGNGLVSSSDEKIIANIYQDSKEILVKEDCVNEIAKSIEFDEIIKFEQNFEKPIQTENILLISESNENTESHKFNKVRHLGSLTKPMGKVPYKISNKDIKLKPPTPLEGSKGCSICDKRFTTQTLLNIHTAANHVITVCRVEWCLKECESRKLERKHFTNKHSRDQGMPRLKEAEAPSPCNKCGKELKTKSGMRYHLKNHEALNTALEARVVLCNSDREEVKKEG